MLSAVDIPLVITGSVGWGNQTEAKCSRSCSEAQAQGTRRIYHLEFSAFRC